MIERSLKIYVFGFIVGVIVCFALVISRPELYYAFLAALLEKAEKQTEALGGNVALSISLNNVFASLFAAYGGYLLSRIFFFLNSSANYGMPGLLGILNAKSKSLPTEKLRYYLALYGLPSFVLFINGFVLGAFLLLYTENLYGYFANLLPHGFFEVPGILVSGNIGLTIADGSLFGSGDLRAKLDGIAKKQLPRYLIVVELLVIGALLEALPPATTI